ncbi:ABC transporter substrate-binding protein [Bradyrhizobium sp. 83002]|uniref:ABC transporter substrate-binding protein n=1 Tax=Bradyrhizobium aeschynomenes TaxID=2734909 RepID=UPI0015538120|nr:ABC transporter substrate-binding protein [Bradyrhizobium aeschynomenes]NPU11487.1 ABC transporter substrate-binding protein [Bradyrhizobium aeschynomenes]
MKFKSILLAAVASAAMVVASAAAELPAEIKQNGLRIAVVPNYPPMEFKDPATATLTGFDVELGEALAKKLGVKAVWQETSFDQLMPGLATQRFDIILTGMTDLKSRQETASFIDYLRSGPRFFVQASRAAEFKEPAALCGKKVGASRRTMFPKDIAAWSDKNCGATPIEFVGTEGSADARTQLKQGRIDAAVQGNETLPYIMDLEPNTYVPVGTPIAFQYTGLATPVKAEDLREALRAALEALIADGSYKALLAKWKLSDNAIGKVTINAGQ